MHRAVAKYFTILSHYLRPATETFTLVQNFTDRDADPETPKHETGEPRACLPNFQKDII
jgi:hypothetical protein